MATTTAAGTALAISAGTPATDNAAGYAALTYTEINNVESIGAFGSSFDVVTFQPLKGPVQKHKGPVNYGSLNPTFAVDASDAGQTLLRTAGDDTTSKLYAFQITLPNGEKRQFGARVFGNPETVDGAASIVTASPVIEISTPIYKVAAPST